MRARVRDYAILLAFLAALYPVWYCFALRLNDGSGEPAGLFALAAAVGFFVFWRMPIALHWRPICLALAAIYCVGFPVFPPMIRAMVALTLLFFLLRLDRRAPALGPLLLLSLPVMATVQFYFGYPLRLVTAVSVEALVDWLPIGESVTRHGTVLWWGDRPVGVDPPCSGVQMLWSGLFLHFVLATRYRHSWRRLLGLTPLAILAILLANVLRGFLLIFQEAQVVQMPEWTHVGIGVIVFGGLAAGWARVCSRNRPPREPVLNEKPHGWKGTLVAVTAIAIAPLLSGASSATASAGETAAFPQTFEGERLSPLPLSRAEQSFARGFPGALGVFETRSGRRIILRKVTRPTRKLHSSADCLKAAGYRLESRFSESDPDWQHWRATHPVHGAWRVRERLENHDQSWSEVSAWYWSAALGRSTGPWQAVTVMERESL